MLLLEIKYVNQLKIKIKYGQKSLQQANEVNFYYN